VPDLTMNPGSTTFPPARLLSIISIYQFAVISLGFLFTRAFLQFTDGTMAPEFRLLEAHLEHSPLLTRWALFVKEFGFWGLLVPAGWWTFFTVKRLRGGAMLARGAIYRPSRMKTSLLWGFDTASSSAPSPSTSQVTRHLGPKRVRGGQAPLLDAAC
jgi:hypothetical protein